MTDSRADRLADQLSLGILRGTIHPGTRLPAVRALAQEHGLSASTIQKVLMVLEVRGLVRSHNRSGIMVLDPARHASLSVWPLLIRHGHETPSVTRHLLDDVFATRRTLAIDGFRAVLGGDRTAARLDLKPGIDAFVAATKAGTLTAAELCAAEHELLRTVMVVAKRPAVLGILNGIERVLSASSATVVVLYRDPHPAAQIWSSLLVLLEHPDPMPLLPLLQSALTLAEKSSIGAIRSLFPMDPSKASP